MQKPEKYNFAVICPMRSEARPLIKKFGGKRHPAAKGGRVYEADIEGVSLLIAIVGVGKKNARKNLGKILKTYAISSVIVVGVAGAVKQNLRCGDLLWPIRVWDSSDGLNALPNAECPALSFFESGGFEQGDLLQVDRIFHKRDKEKLVQSFPEIVALDMESWSLLDVCRAHHVSGAVLRVILDGAGDEVPPFELVVGPTNLKNILVFIGRTIRSYRATLYLLRLPFLMNKSLARLGEALSQIFRSAPLKTKSR